MCSLFSVDLAPSHRSMITAPKAIDPEIQNQQPVLTDKEVLVEGLGRWCMKRDSVALTVEHYGPKTVRTDLMQCLQDLTALSCD